MENKKQTIEVPFHADKELVTRWENYLSVVGAKYKKKGRMGEFTYIIEVGSAQDAYWFGCNSIALLNKLFDGSLTTTLQG